jgi:hypothetical protein
MFLGRTPAGDKTFCRIVENDLLKFDYRVWGNDSLKSDFEFDIPIRLFTMIATEYLIPMLPVPEGVGTYERKDNSQSVAYTTKLLSRGRWEQRWRFRDITFFFFMARAYMVVRFAETLPTDNNIHFTLNSKQLTEIMEAIRLDKNLTLNV